MKVHTYAPTSVQVLVPGDGNRCIVGTWPDGEQVVLVLAEDTAKVVGEQLTSTAVEVYSQLPPGIIPLDPKLR